jgi:predicted amino acid racemase
MFLDRLVDRNAALVQAAVELHQRGDLPPASYVIDLDALYENGVALCEEARRLGLTVLGMTKQFGRNPVAIKTLERAGVDAFVAVDTACAEAIHRAGAPLGHVGHLVQIPRHQAAPTMAMGPRYWTVFNTQKAEEIGEAAGSQGREQAILARVFGENDLVFESHAGGFDAASIEAVATQLSEVDGCRFAGVSSYPALTFDRERNIVKASPNLVTLRDAARALARLGFEDVEVNAPGVTSTSVLSILADAGATQVEPGHGFTGTTPLHAVADLVERPAMIWVSEISHTSGGFAYCFGGGLYQCIDTLPGGLEALVGRGPEDTLRQRTSAYPTPYQEIDFYVRLDDLDGRVAAGDTVVFCFRPQVFYTRALVAPVSGIGRGEPHLEGLFDSQGFAR